MVRADGLEEGALLHQGAIGVGEVGLSKYIKVNYEGPVYITVDSLPGTLALFSSIKFLVG